MKLKNLLKICSLAVLATTFSACSFIKKDEVPLAIEEITWITEEDGDIVVTITYNDETKDPVEFTIPKGESGIDGNSITSIEPYIDPQTGATTITISFSDPTMEDVTFSVPSSKGIQNISQEVDDEGNTIITIEFTDGTFAEEIKVFKGNTGNGIESIEPTYNIDGSITLLITYTDKDKEGNPITVTVNIPAPEKGNGISYIESGETDDGRYYLVIHYTDEGSKPDTVYFSQPPHWYTVYEQPKNSEYLDGDYAFDIVHDVIYVKQNGNWIVAVDFSTLDTIYTVSFDLNAPDAMFASGNNSYQIHNGQSFLSSQYALPLAARPGYTFGGWSTSKTPNPTNGIFTDLTPVLCKMTLYAIWNN